MVVRAKDAWGNEDTNSIEISATPTNSSVPDTFPPVFNGVSNVIDLKTGRTLKLIWETAVDAENSNPITYNIYYTIYSGNQHFESPSCSTQNNYIIIDNLNKDQTLYFVVRAEDYFGNEDNNIKELTGTPTKIGEDNITIDGEIKIYPNPVFGNETNLIIKSASITSIEIFSINGIKIANLGSNVNLTSDTHAVWNTAGVASGIYIYILKDNSGKTYVGKIAIIK
ncbi:T9SS type A sorting domain-containing protein [Candidatus Dependentiae bacterium]|nr:T9SS type A sorting domain-containing protein [Candidatus Dependentiae bacterium]